MFENLVEFFGKKYSIEFKNIDLDSLYSDEINFINNFSNNKKYDEKFISRFYFLENYCLKKKVQDLEGKYEQCESKFKNVDLLCTLISPLLIRKMIELIRICISKSSIPESIKKNADDYSFWDLFLKDSQLNSVQFKFTLEKYLNNIKAYVDKKYKRASEKKIDGPFTKHYIDNNNKINPYIVDEIYLLNQNNKDVMDGLNRYKKNGLFNITVELLIDIIINSILRTKQFNFNVLEKTGPNFFRINLFEEIGCNSKKFFSFMLKLRSEFDHVDNDEGWNNIKNMIDYIQPLYVNASKKIHYNFNELSKINYLHNIYKKDLMFMGHDHISRLIDYAKEFSCFDNIKNTNFACIFHTSNKNAISDSYVWKSN